MTYVTYLIETAQSPERIAEKLAFNQSTGTFTPVPHETPALRERFAIKVQNVEQLETVDTPSLPILPVTHNTPGPYHRAKITLDIPVEMTGADLSTLLTVIAGGSFDLKGVSAIRIVDLNLPSIFGEANPGPQFGIEGTREIAGVQGRPIIGSIIKPSVGLAPEVTAEIVRELASAGVDFIKDDEKLTSPAYSPLEKRARLVMNAVKEAAAQTMYAFNISDTDPEQMVRNHDTVVEAGGKCVMVNINMVGIAGLLYLRKRAQLPIQGHRNGWGLLTRCPSLGWDFSPYNKIWRLMGVDHMHVNGLRNKYWEPDASVIEAIKDCTTPIFKKEDRVFPVIGSAQWAGQAPDTYRLGGTVDVIYLCGGGIQGHPDGAAAGVLSVQQGWEAAMKDIPLTKYAEEHTELKQALKKFGQMKM